MNDRQSPLNQIHCQCEFRKGEALMGGRDDAGIQIAKGPDHSQFAGGKARLKHDISGMISYKFEEDDVKD